MISSNEFILLYNEMFKYLESEFGEEELVRFWRYVRDNYLTILDSLVKEKGLKGIHEYWAWILSEEGGRYNITLRDDELVVDIHSCPSVGKLIHNSHIIPYKNYCDHCPVLYPPLVEKYGFKMDWYIIDREKGACRMQVHKK